MSKKIADSFSEKATEADDSNVRPDSDGVEKSRETENADANTTAAARMPRMSGAQLRKYGKYIL